MGFPQKSPNWERASQCDMFALVRAGGRTISLAVEGKVNEPFGTTLAKWLSDGSDGKRLRLGAICKMPSCDPGAAPGLRYQLFHRTAAAVVEARRFGTAAAAMIVHAFSPEHRWFDDFAVFCALFCTTAQRGTPSVVILPDGRPLILGWATGNRGHLAKSPAGPHTGSG
jgi:hypothetical protein